MLLLDTHILLGVSAGNRRLLDVDSRPSLFVSVASLWEIAIKVRAEKLTVTVPVQDYETQVEAMGCTLIPIQARHVFAEVDPWPDTKDPFDRLLLAVCAVEGLRLVTRDRKLLDHPLAWRPASA